jgi:hypothetical protein
MQKMWTLAMALLSAGALFGQSTLALSSATASGGSVALNLSLNSPAGGEPAAAQWTLNYAPSAVVAISATAGTSATNAGKTLACTVATSGSFTCLLSGMNVNRLANGVVAIINVTLAATATTVPITVINAAAADTAGSALALSGTGGTVTAPIPPPTLTSLSCAPTINTPGTSACTVTICSPAPAGGSAVALAKDKNILTVPASVTVAASGTTAAFTATANTVTGNQSVIVTATLNGSSATSTITLAPPPISVTSLSCAPNSLASNATSTCTVVVSAVGGGTLALASNRTALSVPASVTVSAVSTTASFVATAGIISAAQMATVTASLNGASQPASISLVPPSAITSLVTTSPRGLNITIDGTTLPDSQNVVWDPATSHNLNTPSPQGSAGTRYVYQSWSDGGQQSHSVTAPSAPATYTATFHPQFLLTGQVSPLGGGALIATPVSPDGFYDPAAQVQLTATPAPGYQFSAFSGDLTGSAGTQQVSMSVPRAVTGTFQTVPAAFVDVTPGDFFYDAANIMRARSITAGCSTSPLKYCPQDNITRAQMAIFVVRAVMGGDTFTFSNTPHFNDVSPSSFGFAWIQKLFELGVTGGCGNSLYCPNDIMTRGQMAVFITRARLGAAADSTFRYPSQPYFTDVPASDPLFKWIQRARFDSITAGCGSGTIYCPNDPVTRGQMAIFIVRGGFNQLMPSGKALLSNVSPSSGGAGQTVDVTIKGINTHFTAGPLTVAAGPGVTVSNLSVTQDNSMTARLTITNSAAAGPRTIVVTSATEEANLVNGFVIR